MEEDKIATILLCVDSKTLTIPHNSKTNAEQVIVNVCKQLGIGPVARHLFALRLHGTKIWFPLNFPLMDKNSRYDFRIRFKVRNLTRLKKVDIRAYDYYFHQARTDVLENKIPDVVYENVKRELIGLGVADMYRVMLEKDLSREAVESDYKKYVPKEVIKRHLIFVKRPIHDLLGKIKKASHDAWFVKAEYLNQFETIAPDYLTEDYKAVIAKDGAPCHIVLRVSPFHADLPGIRVCYDNKKEWQQLCAIEDLCYISIRNDGTVEISRKNGIPTYLKFSNLPSMHSFVSLLDGYYRLRVKWIFNICKDITTPSLQKLYSLKCHGPVGGEFSYAKLQEKRNNKHGCYILRESELKYNIFYIDTCPKDSKTPKTYKIEKINEEEYIFNDDVTRYKTIAHLISAYSSNADNVIYLHECLPPSEYDKSPLLLCEDEGLEGEALTDSSSVALHNTGNPLCINVKNLQVYKGQKKESSDGATFLYRSMWKFDKGKKLEVSIRVLKSGSCDNYLKEFVEVAGAWSGLGPSWSGLVRMWGMSLCNPTALILEHSPLGSLSEYLSQNTVQSVDLLEAASHLASALWHLEENGVVHGKIRCRKILVFCHNEDSFLVKLADPGIHVTYGTKDIYWIPVECYPNLELARRSHTADVWAFGTTLWELFMNGQSPPELNQIEAMRFHASGKRLAAPQNCPMDVYQLMRKCWDADPYRRIKPQTILRDINQLLYQVFNSRRKHPYATVFSKSFSDAGSVSAVSVATEDTLVSHQDELLSLTGQTELDNNSVSTFPSCDNDLPNTWLRSNSQDLENDEDAVSCDMSNILSSFNFSTPTTSLDSINSIPSIFELGADCNVVLQGRIGQGFYGEVYKGILERVGDKDAEPRQVAVKKLKTNTQNAGLQDFEREIAIMKRLKHPNIVEILGVLEELDVSLVMEYVPHGSLQNYLKIHKESLTIKQLLNYALDVTKGMDYLGQEHIVHRDLATRNLLVVDENHVKISDFGLAQVVGKNEYYILRTNRDLPIKWYALESLKDGKFSSKSDVWSFGVTMYEMFSLGEEPMLPMGDNANIEGQEQQILLNALESGARFPCPSICPQSVYVRIMYPCWKAIPNERPSFHQLSSDIQELIMQTS